MRKLIGSALLFAVVAVIPAESLAQRRPAPRRAAAAAPAPRTSFGTELAFGSKTDFALGARGVFGLRSLFPRKPIDAQLGFLYFFPSAPGVADWSYWEINGNIAYRIANPRSSIKPYIGGGLNLAHESSRPTVGAATTSKTHAGLNLLGGTTFRVKGTITPFGEARVRVGGGADQFVIAGGARFQL